MALVLLRPGAAEAFAVKCATPNSQGILHKRSTRQAKWLGPNPSNNPASAYAAFAQEHGSKLGMCEVLLGRARLGGQPGLLITTTDTKRNKTWLFCRGARGTDCVLRTAKPREKATGWAKASLTTTRLASGQFAYMIKREEASDFLIILFGPDITAYPH
jgi:hypothetical protein